MHVAVEDVDERRVARGAEVAGRDSAAPDPFRVLLRVDEGALQLRETDQSCSMAVGNLLPVSEADHNQLLVLAGSLPQQLVDDLGLELVDLVREVQLVDQAQRVGAAAEEEEPFHGFD